MFDHPGEINAIITGVGTAFGIHAGIKNLAPTMINGDGDCLDVQATFRVKTSVGKMPGS